MKNYQFQYSGKTYECIGEDKDKQIANFNFIIETQDWQTMENRIKNQLRWHKDSIKEVVEIKEETNIKFW